MQENEFMHSEHIYDNFNVKVYNSFLSFTLIKILHLILYVCSILVTKLVVIKSMNLHILHLDI